MTFLRHAVLALGIAGGLLFGLAFALSFAKPIIIEQAAKEIIRRQIEVRTHEKIEALDAGFLGQKAEGFMGNYAEQIDAAKQRLAERLPERVAGVVEAMLDPGCACRKQIASGIQAGFNGHLAILSQLQDRLTAFIQEKYRETAARLLREFRIFTGTNALVFGLLAFAVLSMRQAGLHLLPSAVVLLLAASTTAYLYLFQQNWLRTLVFGDYAGFAYAGYLGVVFACFSDIFLNRARATAWILNRVLDVLDFAIEVAPLDLDSH
jgi:hypothetical protein